MGAPHDITFRLERRDSSAPRARTLLRAAFDGAGICEEPLETAELVLSELVTNALRAPAPGDRLVRVRAVYDGVEGLLRVEVGDAGLGWPSLRAPDDDATGGRGLRLVSLVAERWGVDRWDGTVGKTVWAEVKAPGPVDVPSGQRVAAITVRCGQRIWERGAWRRVSSARPVWHAAGGMAVVLRLADGQGLRLCAGDPVTVHVSDVTAADG